MNEAALHGSSRALRAARALLLLLPVASCGSSTERFVAPSPSRCAVDAQVETNPFAATGGSGTIRIATNRECAWSVQSDAAWITVPPESRGQGDGAVQFTVAPNRDPASRSAGLSVNDQRLAISQEGSPCQFRLSSTVETVDASGGQRTIRIEASSAQCTWSAEADVSWISVVSGRTGTGNGTTVFDVSSTNGPPRIGRLTVAGKSIRVEQGTGCSYATGTTAVSVSSAGGRGEVAVLAAPGCAWSATSDVPWITLVAGQAGNGNGTVVFEAAPVAGPARTGTLTVAGRSVRIDQGSGCTSAAGVNALDVSASGGVLAIPVNAPAGCPWTADSQTSWLSIASGSTGAGTGTVHISVPATDGPLRTGTVVVAGTTVTVTQASGCRPTVEPDSYDAPGGGGESALAVRAGAGCPWSAASDVPWVDVRQPSGTGSAQMVFAVAPNSSPQRSGTLRVAGHTITVHQASLCTWELAPPVHDFGPDGGRGNVLVIVGGSCTWTAASTAGWITMEAGESGAGNGLVQFIVAPNNGPARSGTVRIAGIDYVVRQAAR
ncbi:MAG TPA: BACON domain-containing carbohydrate-binding protein [Vicinamibacterales bacterium]|nr:BACON domain-containing carbohydrate-binding protein [Vicinamibacterales bacterium]